MFIIVQVKELIKSNNLCIDSEGECLPFSSEPEGLLLELGRTEEQTELCTKKMSKSWENLNQQDISLWDPETAEQKREWRFAHIYTCGHGRE